MDNLKVSIARIFQGAVKSFSRFPASIFSAIVISIFAIIRISMPWETQKTYSLFFDSIQMAFFLSAVFSMAAVVYSEVKDDGDKSFFLLSNISGIVVAIITFLLLYFFGGRISSNEMISLSSIAIARVTAAAFVSITAFVYMISKAKTVDSFSDAFFISHKAFIISAIYGLVMMIGISGVLGAFETLVYKNMNNDIYQYLAVAVSFLTYSIFLGYFPSFSEDEKTEKMIVSEEQPRFIFVLLGYILVPIIMALTVVLLLWTVRVLFKGVDMSFTRLSSITSSYVIVGIWLHIMVADHHTKITDFYKRAYPFSAVLVLAFEAWALIVQLGKFGLKTSEYSFTMVWIFAVVSVIFLIFSRDKAYRKIAITAMVIAIIWVLPFIGYQDITFNSQVGRLEKLLTEEGLLVNNDIVSSDGDLEKVKKGEITDAVDFISYSEKTNTPAWFRKDLNEGSKFKETFGFEKTYGVYPEDFDYMGSNVMLETEVIDISDYPLAVNINMIEKTDVDTSFKGRDGNYQIIWETEPGGIPKITVKLDDRIIIEEDLKEYLAELILKYPLDGDNEGRGKEAPFEDMSLILEGEDLSILIVLNNVNFYYDKYQEDVDHYVSIQGVYMKYE